MIVSRFRRRSLALPSAITPNSDAGTPTTLDSQTVASVASGDTLLALAGGSRNGSDPAWNAATGLWTGTPTGTLLFGDNYNVSSLGTHIGASLFSAGSAITSAVANYAWTTNTIWGPVHGLVKVLGAAVSHQLSPQTNKGTTGTEITGTFGTTPAANSLIIGLVHQHSNGVFVLPGSWTVLFNVTPSGNSRVAAIARIGAHDSATVTSLAASNPASIRLIELRRS